MTRREILAMLALPGVTRAATVAEALAAAQVPSAILVTAEANKDPSFAPYNTTPQTLYAAASLSKQLTAYAILREPRIDIDRPLNDHPTITPRILLGHASGWPNWRFDKSQTLQAGTPPGKKFRYSGEGYVRLQALIEEASGQPFAAYMREKVFTPLGIRNASFAWHLDGPRAEPHNRSGEIVKQRAERAAKRNDWCAKANLKPEDLRVADQVRMCEDFNDTPLPNWFPINAAASLEITAEDYAKFLQAAFKEKRFEETVVPVLDTKAAKLAWGLGWAIEERSEERAGRYLWQWGDNGGYKNFVWLDTAKRKAYAVFTNGDKGRPVYERILRQALKMEPAAFSWLG
jgi:CubicO group peptidase (beta-lactamase class C family)